MFHAHVNNNNKCEIICKMQYLKNGLQFNVTNESVSPMNPIPGGRSEFISIVSFSGWRTAIYWL